jgi:anti-sigma B factor antagonist
MPRKKSSPRSDGACELRLEDDLTIYNVARLKEDLLGQLGHCQSMRIDLSSVDEMDSAGLQIMLMLEKEAAQAGKELRFVGHSAAVIDVLETLNVVSHFGDPIVQLAGETKA